jgi:hypothetical protein
MIAADCPKCGLVPQLHGSAETIRYIEKGQNKEIKVVVVCGVTPRAAASPSGSCQRKVTLHGSQASQGDLEAASPVTG